MSAESMMNFITDILESPEKFGDLKNMVDNALNNFQNITEQLKNASPEDKEKFMEAMENVKTDIQEQMDGLAEKSGMTLEEMRQIVDNADEFAADEKQMNRLREKLDEKIRNSSENNDQKKKRVNSRKKKWFNA